MSRKRIKSVKIIGSSTLGRKMARVVAKHTEPPKINLTDNAIWKDIATELNKSN